MDIKNLTFVQSASSVSQIKNTLSEVCLVGRSNVGKSSFINMLGRNGKLAKTSKTPGRTRLINLFNADDKFMLVDLPGYGYAEASTAEQNVWAKMINDYLAANRVKLTIMLVDVRHEPSEKDKQMIEWLYSFNDRVIIVATKVDKIKKSEREKNKLVIARALKVGASDIILSSAETGEGRNAVIDKIYQILGDSNEDLGA
ncbi:MAG: YihA family ribosome biogenesis GTP-binding protein [Clostridia bacterium]|nr:YihA family ribosome biogenesis GTP-binding protein [Clostridia bacterium]